MKLEFSRRIFKKYSNIKLRENPPGESRVLGNRQTDRQTGMMQVLVAFLKFCIRAKNALYSRVTIVKFEAMSTAIVKAPIHSHIFGIFAAKHKRVILLLLLLLLLFAKASLLLGRHAA